MEVNANHNILAGSEAASAAVGPNQEDHEVGWRRKNDQLRGASAVRQGGRNIHFGADAARVGAHRGQQAAHVAA